MEWPLEVTKKTVQAELMGGEEFKKVLVVRRWPSGLREIILFRDEDVDSVHHGLKPSKEPFGMLEAENNWFFLVSEAPAAEAWAEWRATGLVRVELWERGKKPWELLALQKRKVGRRGRK